MSSSAVLTATVSITVDSVAKVFNNVLQLKIDYFHGTINIVDVTGSFFFKLTSITTFTYTIVGTGATLTLT